jgi:dTDP-4-amino-4,6-dideoxygalactose transaminase
MAAKERLAILGGKPAMPEDIERTRWPRYSEQDLEELCRVLREEQLAACDAPQVLGLQEDWARKIGVDYCYAVGSGTDALHMALWAAGVGPGDEVLVPAYTFLSNALVVLHQGAAPVFVDVQRDSYNMDPDQIEQHITPRTKAIFPVHLGGLPADMDEINAVARRHDLVVIEDACHAPGATYKNRFVGNLGDAAGLSINAMKNLPSGEAGLFSTRHQNFYERVDALWLRVKFHEPREELKYPLATLGYNYRCNVMSSTLARCQLAKLDELNTIRKSNCERLTAQLLGIPGVIPPQVPHDRSHVYHLYRVRFDPKEAGIDVTSSEFRAKVVAALGAEGVLCRAWMNWTIPSLPIFTRPEDFESRYPWQRPWRADYTYNPRDYPEAIKVVEETSLVMEAPTAISAKVIDYMADGFHKVFSHLDDVMKLELPQGLMDGSAASLDEIRRLLPATPQIGNG